MSKGSLIDVHRRAVRSLRDQGEHGVKQDGLTIAITGAAGYVAGRLIRTLIADDRVDRVLGFDVIEPDIQAQKFVFDQIDVRNKELCRRFEGVDVVVHLAFIMDPIQDETLMRDVNVNGSHNVFEAAAAAAVRKIVYTSSATVYGAHADNPVPLTEESPLRANLDFSYPAHKLEVEYLVRDFREQHPDIVFTLFRPAIVFGANVDNAWSHIMEMPVLPLAAGHRPPMQFVHEEDVADALAFAVHKDLDGAYNLAPDGWMESEEVLAMVGRRPIDLPEPTLYRLADRMWRLGLAEAPAGIVHYITYPWVVSAAKLAAGGFSARRSNPEALGETVEQVGGTVRIGRKRYEKARLARGAAGFGAAAALGMFALKKRSTARV
jgi:nucleoside-diphosphate-sugar epimerase